MALARIISRSHHCWRELALDLLARGYAVELVSSDAIPENFADLEFRVEDEIGDLRANVAAGEHSKVLDLVHHLRAPMEDFVRRPPRAEVEAAAMGKPINFNAEPNLLGEVEIPGATLSRDLGETTRTLALLPSEEGARLVTATERAPQLAGETSQLSRTVLFHRAQSKQEIQSERPEWSSGWFLRASAGFAVVILLGTMLPMGFRHGDSMARSAQLDPQNALALNNANIPLAPQSQYAAAANGEKATAGSRGWQTGVLKALPGARSRAPRGNSKVGTALGKVDDLTSQDTTIYRDKPDAKAAPDPRVKSHHFRDDTIAPDTVTYLDRNVAGRDRLR